MQVLFVYPVNFRWKNADVSWNQGIFQMIYIFFLILFRQGIIVESFIIVVYYVPDFRWDISSGSSPANAHSK